MRPYEVMIILDATLEDDGVQGAIDRATQLISSRGGTPGKIDRWGKRRFAYELDHRWEGIYVLLQATAEPGVMDELDRSLRLADEVLRHKVIRLPDEIAGDTPAAKETVAADAATSANGA